MGAGQAVGGSKPLTHRDTNPNPEHDQSGGPALYAERKRILH
jgi:hypothetical protein